MRNVGLYAGPSKEADLYLQGFFSLLQKRESVSKIATFKLSLADLVVGFVVFLINALRLSFSDITRVGLSA